MKLIFTPKDSIYKIFKIIKKIPHGKAVEISLDDHPLLNQKRRMDALVVQFQESALQVIFTTGNKQIADYLQTQGVTTVCTADETRRKYVQNLVPSRFFPSSSQLPSREYLKSKLSLITELMVLGIIIYIFRWTISPKATIRIDPAVYVQPLTYSFLYYPADQEIPHIMPLPLAIPIYSWSVTYRTAKTIDLSSFTTDLLPAKWTVTLYNTLDEAFALLGWTTLSTVDGLSFTFDDRINLPAGTPDMPWKARVHVTAWDYKEDGSPIGELGNISKDTQLLIKKLSESRVDQAIRAEPVQAFTKGQTIVSGTVVSADIEQMEKVLMEDIQTETPNIIRKHLASDNLVLPIPQEIKIITERFLTNAQPGQTTSFLQGTMEVIITYPYIHKADLIEQTELYISQRSTLQQRLWGISIDNTIFYDPRTIATGVYTLPTTIQTFRWYDFEHDNHNLIATLRKRITGMSKQEAQKAILSLSEVQNATISFSPPWYDTLPKSWEKITITPKRLKLDTWK